MPLIKGKSKKAFDHNVEAEMDAGKPKDQSLAIAFNVKRKKKAHGGVIRPEDPHIGIDEVKPDKGFGKIIIMKAEGGPISADGSAKHQKRPMPDAMGHDSADVRQNSGNKPPHNDGWSDRPDIAQSQRGGKFPLKHPKMVPQSAYSVKLRDQEDDLQSSASTNEGPQEQPPSAYNEEDADKSGPKVPDMQAQHNNHRKPYANGGAIDREAPHSSSSEQYHDAEHKPQMHDSNPAHDSHPDYDMDSQPVEEAELEHAASLAAAVMARRKYARGGAILSEDSMESDDSSQADLSRNAQEDANMEDKASFDALRKENYDESSALMELDHPLDSNMHGDESEMDSENERSKSIADRVRSRMKKSPISR